MTLLLPLKLMALLSFLYLAGGCLILPPSKIFGGF